LVCKPTPHPLWPSAASGSVLKIIACSTEVSDVLNHPSTEKASSYSLDKIFPKSTCSSLAGLKTKAPLSFPVSSIVLVFIAPESFLAVPS